MLHRGYIQSWNATIERKLPWEMIGNVAYVATPTIHQLIDIDINTVGASKSAHATPMKDRPLSLSPMAPETRVIV